MIAGVRMRLDHVSIAVRSVDRAYEWFKRYFPVDSRNEKRREDQLSGSFNWLDFWIGGFAIELIEDLPAKPEFVHRFIEKHGEGMHHLSLEVDDLRPVVEALKGGGVRVVDEQIFTDGTASAFISPRSAFGVLIQFWQPPQLEAPEPAPNGGGLAHFDHVSLAVKDIRRACEFFIRYFPAKVVREPELAGSGGGFILGHLDLAGFKLELLQSAGSGTKGDFVGEFIAKHGEGMHHISIKLGEFDATLDKLRSDGVRIVEARLERRGERQFFISPSSAFGTPIQVWEGS